MKKKKKILGFFRKFADSTHLKKRNFCIIVKDPIVRFEKTLENIKIKNLAKVINVAVFFIF